MIRSLYFVIFSVCINFTTQENPQFVDRIVSPMTKIVGGELANIEDYPYIVSLRVWDIHICGGSILDEKTILTAAHCTVAFDHNLYTIRVGASKRDNGKPYEVLTIYEHPNYNKTAESDHDFSIIKLKSPLLFGPTVKSIPIVDANIQIPNGAMVTTAGWGVTQEGARDSSKDLRQVDLKIITNADCGKAYGNIQITPNMMCAIAPGKDSCQGDSGGPLTYDGQLCGVVSFGIGCARAGIPGIYSRISNNREWIITLMEPRLKSKLENIKTPGDIVGSSNVITNIAEKIVANQLGNKINDKVLISIEKSPYIVSLRCYDQHYCSGVILDESTVITTAHCVAGFPYNDLSIRVGNVNNDLGKQYNISDIVIHPEYSDQTFDYNAAILKLSTKLEFDNTVNFISIPSDDDLSPWSLITVVGWDNNQQNSDQNDVNLLQATELRTIDNYQCGQAYGQDRITNNMFCAIDYSKDYCHSDSGSAAVFNGLLYGLVSTGESCIKSGYPGVYTKISKFYSWINQCLEISILRSTKEIKLLGADKDTFLSNPMSFKGKSTSEPTKNRSAFPYLIPAQKDVEATVSQTKNGSFTISNNPKVLTPKEKQLFTNSLQSTSNIKKEKKYSPSFSTDFFSLTEKIIGGQSIDIKDFPYQASLRVLNRHICGAVIINQDCLLTSAHCTTLSPVENYSVRVGDTKHAMGTKYEIDSIFIHPLFNKTVLMDADIAIIKLKTPLEFSDNIKPIALMDPNTELPNRAMFVISGWGVTQDGATIVPDNLQAAVINLVDNNYCREVYGDEQITDNMICALQSDVQTCEGDSGAPLVWKNQLVGLASFNVGCTKAGYPGVYVKITGVTIYDWIKKLTSNY